MLMIGHCTEIGLAYIAYFCISKVWGVTIGGTILQNQLLDRLPPDFVAGFPGGTAIAYSIIPTIATLPDALRTSVRNAFSDSLQVVWKVFLGIAAAGMLSSLGMKHMKLHTSVDRDWGLRQEGSRVTDDENRGEHGPGAYELGKPSEVVVTSEVE